MNYSDEQLKGKQATLNIPYLGYTQIELIEKIQYMWRVKICESGKEIEVYPDEFTINV